MRTLDRLMSNCKLWLSIPGVGSRFSSPGDVPPLKPMFGWAILPCPQPELHSAAPLPIETGFFIPAPLRLSSRHQPAFPLQKSHVDRQNHLQLLVGCQPVRIQPSPTCHSGSQTTTQQHNSNSPSPTAQQPSSPTAQQPNSPAAQQPSSPTAQQPSMENSSSL